LLSAEIQPLEKFGVEKYSSGLWGWSQGAFLDLFMSRLSLQYGYTGPGTYQRG